VTVIIIRMITLIITSSSVTTITSAASSSIVVVVVDVVDIDVDDDLVDIKTAITLTRARDRDPRGPRPFQGLGAKPRARSGDTGCALRTLLLQKEPCSRGYTNSVYWSKKAWHA
jgi:hypothetical protein